MDRVVYSLIFCSYKIITRAKIRDLTFRDKVELLEPQAVREELRQSILQIAKKYDQATDH